MERLKALKNTLMACVEGQMGNLQETDTHELGEAIDMIKDLEEAMYYCSIVKAMEKAEKEEETMGPTARRYYGGDMMMPFPDIYYPYPYDRDIDKHMGRMYYSERQPRNDMGEFESYRGGRRMYGGEGSSSNGSSSSNGGSSMGGGSRYYSEMEVPFELRDRREGRSPMSRRHYMESKELHRDSEHKMKDLETYIQELGQDITEMIEGASKEEKQLLEKKMTQLTSKIASLNA